MVDTNRVAEANCRELESFLELLFENAATTPIKSSPGRFYGHDPILGRIVISGEDHTQLRLAVCRALIASAKFRTEAPGWPNLPLRREECAEMIDADCVRCNVVGYYGESLRAEGWDPAHPSFAPFVSGLMACRGTPDEIRRNPELWQQFPPVRLNGMYKGLPPYIFNGMCVGGPYWRSPETVAAIRFCDRKVAKYEAAKAAGLAIGP